MVSKKVSVKNNGKINRMMSMQRKQETNEKREIGVRVTELARLYKCRTSTICTVRKQKDGTKSCGRITTTL